MDLTLVIHNGNAYKYRDELLTSVSKTNRILSYDGNDRSLRSPILHHNIKREVSQYISHFLSAMPWLGRKIYAFSALYADIYRGYSYDFHKNGELKLIRTMPALFKSEKPIIFDVGANLGEWTMFAKQVLPGAEIHCFEMSPDTFMTLKSNLKKFANLRLNDFGLSDKPGNSTFLDYGANNGGNTLIRNPCFIHSQNTKETSTTLSTGEIYMNENKIRHIDLLKVDVEGWEYFVLTGFGSYLVPDVISMIQFEYGYTHGDVHTLMKDFYEMLEGKGYIVGRLSRSGIEFSPFHFSLNDFKSGPNFIGCHPKYREALSRFG
jgi:FkbM family methyltransferase